MEERNDKNVKIRNCMVTQMFEYYDVEEIAIIETRIKELTGVKEYCIIIHDKDLLESWEPKKRHFHAVISFVNPTTIWAVAKWLKVETQYVEKLRSSVKSSRLYLVHRNHPEKYQYSPNDVVANFDYIEYVDGCKPKQNKWDIAERIAKWEIKQYNLYDYVTVQEFAENKQYYDKCFLYRQNKIKTMDRNLECVFITWASHTWKTTFAKQMAMAKWYSVYVSSWGKHPLDNYGWEDCIILDDLRDNTYELSDFLKLTDNNTDSLVWCRFYNKSIWECKLLIVTSVQWIHQFYKYQTDERESQVQLFRRFRNYMVMEKERINCYLFNESKDNYEFCGSFKNKVSEMFLKSTATKFFVDLEDTMSLEKYNIEQPSLIN